jgi:hypothetical protein
VKGECALCHASVLLALNVVNGVIQATCPACGKSFPVPVASAPAPDPSPRVVSTVPLPPAPPGAEAAYLACEEKWDDAARHDEFLAICQRLGSFVYAAARYRAAATDRALAEVAGARLRQIRLLAEQALLSAIRSDKPMAKGHALRWIAIAVFVLAFAIGAILFLARR